MSELTHIHTPDRSLPARVRRRLTRYRHRKSMAAPRRSIVTFSFDDCPLSVVETALPMFEQRHWQATLYMATGLCDTTNHLGLHMSRADIQAVHASGHEIADHTYSHFDAEQVSTTTYLADIDRNQVELNALGLPPSRHFAYPYGAMTPEIKRAVGTRFQTARGVLEPSTQMDVTNLPALRLFSGAPLEQCLAAISDLQTTPKWLHLFGHDVRENCSDYGCTPADLARVLRAVEQSDVPVLTVDAAWREITHLEAAA